MTDADSNYCGRPFGGVAIVYRNIRLLSYSVIEADSDRFTGVTVKDVNGNPIQTIISVYMPYYSGVSAQTECFIESIDSLQTTIDKFAHLAPLKILGDFNVKLPRENCSGKWYTKPGYNQHCRIEVG